MPKYTVISNELQTPTTCLLTLKGNNLDRPFVFAPGQYAAISFYKKNRPTVARCFSIASSPTEQGSLQFGMRTGGRFTKSISLIPAGSKVNVRGPYGGFVYNQILDRHAVFLAGGIGITPFISMIRYATELKLENKISLIYSCRNQDDIPFLGELKELEKLNPNFKVFFAIADGPVHKLHGQQVASGRVSGGHIDHVVKGLYKDHSFYICGPSSFMKGMTDILRSKGTPRKNIKTEAFGQGANKQTGKIRSWPFNIYLMGGISMALSGLIVMLWDLFKTLPPSPFKESSYVEATEMPTSSREADLNQLVNSLPDYLSTETISPDAIAAAAATSQLNTSSGVVAKPSTPTKTTQPTPVPTKTLVCKTSPSGIRTCR